MSQSEQAGQGDRASVEALAQPAIQQLRAYDPGHDLIALRRQFDDLIELGANESPYGASQLALAAARSAIEDLHRYPDPLGGDLKRALADAFGLETAQIAVQASLTGHQVLSTLHTNSAVGAVTRLRDMGIEPFLLSSSINGVIAQRLVRRLDPELMEPYQATQAELAAFGRQRSEVVTLYRPKVELAGRHGGYKGRSGLYELVVVDEAMRTLIHDGAGEQALEAAARAHTAGIMDDGWRKCRDGTTSVDEVLKVTREE